MGAITDVRDFANRIIELLSKSPIKDDDVIRARQLIDKIMSAKLIAYGEGAPLENGKYPLHGNGQAWIGREKIPVLNTDQQEKDEVKDALDNMIFWARMYLRAKKNPEAIHRFSFDEVEKEILEAEAVYKKMP